MVLGAGGGDTVAFGIKAVSDLRGVDQTSKALTNLSKQGTVAGSGISKGMDQASTAFGRATATALKLEDQLAGVTRVGLGVGLAIFAGLGFATKGASALAESINKATVVFGQQADDVIEFAENAAGALGLSEQAALEAAGGFGNLFKTMGLGSQVTADMSTSLVALSADLSSFGNIDATQVLEDLRSGLVGETEPLRKYGILLNAAAVEQELVRIGAKKVNGEFTEAQKVQARYNLIMSQTVTAQGDFANTSDAAANSSRIAAAQIRNASDALGTVFLPIVADAAKGVAAFAHAFNELPDGFQSAIAISLAVAGGLALITAAAAKVVAVGLATGRAWTAVAASFGETAVASNAAAVGMTNAGNAAAVANTKSIGLLGTLRGLARFAAAGIIITVGGSLILDAIESAQTGEGSKLESIGIDIVDKIADGIRLVGADRIADAIDDAAGEAQENLSGRDLAVDFGLSIGRGDSTFADQLLKQTVESLPGGDLIPDDWITDVNHTNDVIEELGVSMGELQKRADLSGLSFGEELLRQADAVGFSTPELEAYRESVTATVDVTGLLAETVIDSADAFQDQVDAAITARKEQEQLKQAIQDTQNAEFLASAASEGLFLPFTRNADNAEAATEKFNQTLEEMQKSAINAARGVADIAPELDGLQTGFGKVGDSITDVFLLMDDIGVIDFSLSVREALTAVSALEKVEASIEGVEAAIANNQGDLAMWQARISLVTDTFGANEESISSWIEQLELGQITQEQFNANIAALAGSGGFPKLDALLNANKITRTEYDDAVEAGIFLLQRSAGALSDEEAEIVKNIIALAGYVKGHDDADGAVKALTEDQRGFVAAMADSKVQTFLQTLQLLAYLATIGQIPPEAVTKFIVDSSAADPVIEAVSEDLGLIPDHTVKVDADDSEYQETRTNIENTEIPDQTVTVTAETVFEDFPNIPTFGSGVTPDLPILNVKAVDEVTPVIEGIAANIAQFSADAGTAGTAAGSAFTLGAATAITAGDPAVDTAAQGIVNSINVGGVTYNIGFNAGYNFAIGVANGITSQWNTVFNASYNLGLAAQAGAAAALGIASASKVGADIAQNFVDSLTAGLRSGQSAVNTEAQSLLSFLGGSASSRTAVLGDRRTTGVLAQSFAPASSVSSSRNISIVNHINGITDPQAVSDRVNTDLFRALDRADAAGLFGR